MGKLQYLVILIIAGILLRLKTVSRSDIPEHLTGHPIFYERNLIDEEIADELRALVKQMGSDETGFQTNVSADTKSKAVQVSNEHIGEAQPKEKGKPCQHPYLVPDIKDENWIFAQRVDVGRHFVVYGGPGAIREPRDEMVNRVSSFARYMFDLKAYPVAMKLFSSEKFQKYAQSVCPVDKQVLDPFQFNFIMQIPGQTVATHLDGVVFFGATRFQYPQWLLAVMQFSNLFSERFIDQVQVVGYLHEWSDNSSGNFIYYPENSDEPKRVHAEPLAGVFVDGTKTIHAADTYMPHVNPPMMDKDKINSLFYVGDEKWELREISDDGQRVLKTYDHSDLRISVVYRGRCFASQQDLETFNEHNHRDMASSKSDQLLQLDQILKTLSDDLVAKGKTTKEALETMDRLDLCVLLLDTYIKYPLPSSSTALIPHNYCALPRMFSGIISDFLKVILKVFCE